MTSRHYFYHLKFELYDNPIPTTTPHEKKGGQQAGRKAHLNTYLPAAGSDIFTANLPAHARSVVVGEEQQRPRKAESETRDSASRTQTQHHQGSGSSSIIDCGPSRVERVPSSTLGLSKGKTPRGTPGTIPIPPAPRKHTIEVAVQDWRFGPIRVEGIDLSSVEEPASSASTSIMAGSSSLATRSGAGGNPVRGGINAGPRGHTAKARFEPLGYAATDGSGFKNTELGWGIVHLYRDGEESLDLEGPSALGEEADPKQADKVAEEEVGELDTTILCIPAVPSYMTPSDFLGWVGEKTREEVSHFRMVMTGRMNRYLVLMKFRDAGVARRWRQDWDGRVFGGLEPENCHVMLIKSIVFQTPSEQAVDSFPDTSHDPFTPNLGATSDTGLPASLALKPFPPPTPSLVELPTCPVCLERMDDTTGLLTILCQHVFHCACLSKWRGSGCPVCRHTQPHPSLTQPFGTSASDLCRVCDCPDDLWICLICGHVGCGRYKGGHAKEHWKETAHNYALEIETQHVWDYAGDLWVHRLIQTKGDGKLVELPSNPRPSHGFGTSRGDNTNDEEMEMIPRVKLENIGMEYTHLVTSQLDSQRIYYEDIVKKAVSKASAASKSAEAAAQKAEEALSALSALSLEHAKLRDEVIPDLEKDRDRMRVKAEKSTEIARNMTKNWQEEKKVGEGLMERIKHINEGMASLSEELTTAKAECADLREQNRDLGFFISGQEKLKDLEGELGEEVVEGTLSLPERKEAKDSRGRGKGKGKGRGS